MDLEKIIESNLGSYKRNIPDLYFISRSSSDQIPFEYLSNARETHGIDKSYRIFFMMSNGALFNNCKCSLLILQNGVSVSYGDPFSGYDSNFINWESMQDIKLIKEKNGTKYIIFYFDLNYLEDNFRYAVYNDNSHIVVELLKAISRDVLKEYSKENEIMEDLYKKSIELQNNKEYDNAYEAIEKALILYPGNFYFKKLKAEILFNLDKYDESLKEINDCIEIANSDKDYPVEQFDETDKNDFSDLKYHEGIILTIKEDYLNAIWALKDSYSYSTDNEVKKIIRGIISDVSNKLSAELGNIDYKKRKVIFCSENILKEKPRIFLALSSECLSEIKFPLGHPINGELYVGHPYKNNIYYHYNDYGRQLFQDKAMELSHILECLGAKTISIKYLKGDFNNSSNKENFDIQGSASFIKGVSGKYENNMQENQMNVIGDKMGISQNFAPTTAPYLPEDLLWYNHEITWQKLVDQRLNGNLKNSSITISSKDLSILNSNEITEINAELKGLILKAKGAYTKEINIEIKTEQITEWKIDVEFVPKELLSKNDIKFIKDVKNNYVANMDTNEKEYAEYYEECVINGEITTQVRRILDRLKNKLNIPDDRIMKIESMINSKVSLSESEKEYYDEIIFCLEDDGSISSEERKFLNKLKNKLQIDDNRGDMIEESARKNNSKK